MNPILILSSGTVVIGIVFILIGRIVDGEVWEVLGTVVTVLAIVAGFLVGGIGGTVEYKYSDVKMDRIIYTKDVGIAYLFQHDNDDVESLICTDITVVNNPKHYKVITVESIDSYGIVIEHKHKIVPQTGGSDETTKTSDRSQ